jgi:hypothetical protein
MSKKRNSRGLSKVTFELSVKKQKDIHGVDIEYGLRKIIEKDYNIIKFKIIPQNPHDK